MVIVTVFILNPVNVTGTLFSIVSVTVKNLSIVVVSVTVKVGAINWPKF